MKESKETQRVVCIGKAVFRSTRSSQPCKDCDILKESHLTAPHQYPLCYTHNMQGKQTDGTRGLIVNWCARHAGHTWKKD